MTLKIDTSFTAQKETSFENSVAFSWARNSSFLPHYLLLPPCLSYFFHLHFLARRYTCHFYHHKFNNKDDKKVWYCSRNVSRVLKKCILIYYIVIVFSYVFVLTCLCKYLIIVRVFVSDHSDRSFTTCSIITHVLSNLNSHWIIFRKYLI